jgi:hypothetical protein
MDCLDSSNRCNKVVIKDLVESTEKRRIVNVPRIAVG